MKKSICILILFLVGTMFGVAAKSVTVKPCFAGDLVVSKTSNEAVINTNFENNYVVFYEASKAVSYLNIVNPAPEKGVLLVVSFGEHRTGLRIANNNVSIKRNKIYLLNCSIRQCNYRAASAEMLNDINV